MKSIRVLAGQTATYGFGSIFGRLLNYLLVPLYSRVFLPAEAAVYIEMYAYVAFFIVFLTYGMETAFFRNYQNNNDKVIVYSTTFWSIVFTSSIFILVATLFSFQISSVLRYPDNPEYILYFAFILGIDAICTVPFSKLRAENKAFKFAVIKIINILTNITFNLILILLLPYLYNTSQNPLTTDILSVITCGKADISSIFIANLIASILTLILLLPEMLKARLKINFTLLRSMLIYGFPLLILGLAGIANETLDRILLKYLLPADTAMHQLGIYGMCFKISIFILIFIQAFRYAAEPFFFEKAKDHDAKETYVTMMNYFIIACFSIFLGIMLYIDIVKYFVGPDYYEGLKIVPILLISHIFLGIFYTLSLWYKITDKTKFGAWFSLAGTFVSVSLNIVLIPLIGYMGSAWANFFCYLTIMLLSYFYGQKHYPIPYKINKFFLYMLFSLVLYAISHFIRFDNNIIQLGFNTVLFLIFLFIVLSSETELRGYLNRIIKKII